MVDKNLFLHDLAVVSIMKNESPYVKEWIDYHLLAGANHFFIYDHESTDNFKAVLQPYIDSGIVTYNSCSGKYPQIDVYTDALKKFKFFYRYMTWLDTDEFFFPKDNRSVVDVLDEIFSFNPNAGGILINWHCFGSNGQEKADFSHGVLDRFTRRAENDWYSRPDETHSNWIGNIHVKTIANPRKISYLNSPHFAIYFTGINTIDEDCKSVPPSCLKFPITEKKIVINHYYTKSYEEISTRRGKDQFNIWNRNEIFDDGIIKYRDARKAALIPAGGGMEHLIYSKQVNYSRLFNALAQNLFPALSSEMQKEFFNGKVENFLTCLNLTSYLKGKILDDNCAYIFEEMSLIALYKSLFAEIQIADVELLLREMPKILVMPYDVVEKIRTVLIEIIQQIMLAFRMQNAWQQFTDMEHELEMLTSFNVAMNK